MHDKITYYQFDYSVAMCARVVTLFVFVAHMFVSKCVTVNMINIGDIITKSKIEMAPLLITAGMGDIIILSAPIVDSNTLYYLNKPNGDVQKLKLNMSRVADKIARLNKYNISIKGELKAIINPVNKYRIFNLNYPRNCFKHDYFKEREEDMMSNDFMTGPLVESDHGNWILSAYYKENGEWIELFQVITIEIKDTIPISPARPILYPGEDFYLRFAYPIQDVESCEIVAPRSTFDRFYDRDILFLDSCGFLIPNVTRADEGLWKIIGVGKIVYEANIFLRIKKNVT